MHGPLSDEVKNKILAFINRPNHKDFRGRMTAGHVNLWQACVAFAPSSAPLSGSVGFPDRDTITQAIRKAVDDRPATAQSKREKSKSTMWLKLVDSGKG